MIIALKLKILWLNDYFFFTFNPFIAYLCIFNTIYFLFVIIWLSEVCIWNIIGLGASAATYKLFAWWGTTSSHSRKTHNFRLPLTIIYISTKLSDLYLERSYKYLTLATHKFIVFYELYVLEFFIEKLRYRRRKKELYHKQ